jgi:hypothetical protein|tara:strand:+ start:254 stop:505 length:252 start_codon:yes stop_codon:yes gene_type:complete
MVKEQTGGSPLLQDLTVPVGLFLAQQAFNSKTPMMTGNSSSETIPISLYDRLLGLVGDEPDSQPKTRKVMKKRKRMRKTKKNN